MRLHRAIVSAALSLAAALGPAGNAQVVAVPRPGGVMPALPMSNGRLVEVDFQEAALRDALALIGQSANLNFAATDEAAKTKVTIHLRNVTPLDAVRAICQTQGLFLEEKKDSGDEGRVRIVTTVKEFQQGLTILREPQTEVFTLLYPNATDLASAIRNLYGSRVLLTQGTEGLFSQSDDISRRLDRFDLIDSRSTGLGQAAFNNSTSGGGSSYGNNNNNSSYGGGSSGGGRNSSLGGTSSGFAGAGAQNEINNRESFQQQRANELSLTAEQAQALSKLINGQIAGVEASKLNDFGTDNSPIYVSVVSRNNQVLVRTSDATVLDEIHKLKDKIDVPTPQVLLEMKVLSVDLTDGFTSVFDAQFGDSHNSIGFSSGNIISNGTGPNLPTTPLTIGGTGEAGGPFTLNPTSLIYQYVNDNFRLRMQLLQNRNRVTSLATPILLVANNEVSRVFIGQEYPIVSNISSQTNVTQGVISSTPNTSFTLEPVGTTLLVTPSINADRTVTLRLVQESSSVITGGATIPVVGSNGTVTNQPIDVVSSQTVSGTLVAKDGLSLALGGLITENVTDQREEVPVLGEIPGLGILFRRQITGRTRSEVIVVIRPFILSTPSESEASARAITEANSLHPTSRALYPPNGAAIGSMGTFLPNEVLRPNPPRNQLEKIFRFHSVVPYTF